MKHSMQKALGAVAAAAALALFSCAALAQSASADGEIRKIDAKAGRVIIKHGEWKGMNMQAMTMAFRVRDAAVLNGLKVADTVRFVVEKDGADYVVMPIERSASAQAATSQAAGAGAHVHAH